jgi:hypothetical protein
MSVSLKSFEIIKEGILFKSRGNNRENSPGFSSYLHTSKVFSCCAATAVGYLLNSDL